MRELLLVPSTGEIYIMFSLFLLVQCFVAFFRPHHLNYLYFQIQSFWIFYQCVRLGSGSTFILVKVKLNFDNSLSPY